MGESSSRNEIIVKNNGYFLEIKPRKNAKVKLKFGMNKKKKEVELDINSLKRALKMAILSKGLPRIFSFLVNEEVRFTISPEGIELSDKDKKVQIILQYEDIEQIANALQNN
ncbi:MAG: hypothetical protein ACP6IS_02505 [Candidatus Asgardarchaeia archaeon]